jgi:hypothetical protein
VAGEGTVYTGTAAVTAGSSYYIRSGKISALLPNGLGDTVLTTLGAGSVFTATTSSVAVSSDAAVLIPTINKGLPLYTFNTDALTPTRDKAIGTDMLDEIKAVPNPYYAYSQYETGRLDYRIKIINLPEECTINIFTVNGVLVRTFKKDDPTVTSIDWDLKNQDRIPIASGLYIIHINAPGLGEKVIKWFGVLRPIDLNSF